MRVPRSLALVVCAAGTCVAADWPQFRGTNASGVSDATKLPVEFGPEKKVVWKVRLASGHSSPVISGDRIFLTGAEGGQRADAGRQKVVDHGGALYTICVDRPTGKVLWKREVTRPRLERYQPTNSPASPSPVTDGKSVYAFFGDFGLVAYTIDGAEKWRVPLGPFNNVNGHGSSPILFGNLLILLCDQDTNSYLLAVNKNTGKTEWKVERPESTRSYSTPSIMRPKSGPAEVIVPGAYNLTSYNAATGEKLWWINGLSWQPKSSPIIDGDMIYAHWWESGGESETTAETPTFADMLAKFDADHDGRISLDEVKADLRLQKQFPELDLDSDGYLTARDWDFYRARRGAKNALLAVRHGGRGDLSGSIVWRMQKFLPNCPTPLLYQGVMYLVKDGGIVTSIDPKTGNILKQGRLTGALETYYSSPVGGAGKVYMISQGGKVSVLKAGGEWEILAVNDLDDEVFATPAIVDNRLYIRTRSTLYCFAE
jgi:outer membrane protein assembly factor BamB